MVPRISTSAQRASRWLLDCVWVGWFCLHASSTLSRRPALVHSLWLLVLLKLITPPLVPLRIIPWPEQSAVEDSQVKNRQPLGSVGIALLRCLSIPAHRFSLVKLKAVRPTIISSGQVKLGLGVAALGTSKQ